MFKNIFLISFRFFTFLILGGTLWVIGLIFFTHIIPSSPNPPLQNTDGIVVFTGGKTRLKVALSLFEEEKGKFLLISGVNPGSRLSDVVGNIPQTSHITLGYNALDTVGNAEETLAWVRNNSLKSIRLITSNYHMPRSLFELRRLLPDVLIVSYPVVGNSFLRKKWWLEPETLKLVIQEYHKFIFALIRRPIEDVQSLFKCEK